MILEQKNTSENDHFRQQIWRRLFKQISLPKSLQNQALDSHEGLQKRSGFHWSNAMPFFDDPWSDFGSQKAPNPPCERHPKMKPKTYVRGKPIPAKEREARYLSLQSSQKLNRGCRNPSPDAEILARMPES